MRDADRKRVRVGMRLAGATLLAALAAAGCGKRKPDVAPPPPAAEAAPKKTGLQQRMENPEYLATLKALQAEREVKAAEATQVRNKLTEVAHKVEQEDAAAIALRQEINTLQAQITEKEKALSDLTRQNPEWIKLEESYRAVEADLDAIRQRSQATVQQKMLEQVAARKAAAEQAGTRTSVTPQAPTIQKAPAQPSFAPIVVTNAGVGARPVSAPVAVEESP